MKIHVEIANGYRSGRIKQLIHDNPSWDSITATRHFIDHTYGAWISDNLDNEYEITDVTENSFQVCFTYEDDANAFRKQLGGQIMEEGE